MFQNWQRYRSYLKERIWGIKFLSYRLDSSVRYKIGVLGAILLTFRF